ncbi:MAG: flagellar hook-associated protein FlgL [Deltaproteobacteria bacterium]|nr:flagellar hook-associated protein FlgL [Deltaproteobacteria bacterium]
MRVTQNITYNTYINDIMRRQESIYKLATQLSTGKSVNAPSDDPVKTDRILTSKSIVSGYEQYERNMDSGLSYLNTAEDTLASVKDVLMTLQELATSAATGTSDASTRANAATTVSQLYDQLVSLGNTNFDGKYIFAGYETGTAPFDQTGNYLGDTNAYQIRINSTGYMTVGVNGGEVFKGAGGGVDILQTVTDLVTALNGNDSTGIQTAIGNLDQGFQQVSDSVSVIGGRITRITSAKDDLVHSRNEVEMMISTLEEADIAKVISELKLGQTALEAAMTSAGKVISVNIFDYM